MKILFICLGNTCRSPMAESVMKQKIKENQLDWVVDSAALRDWNVGLEPEDRCLKVLAENGLTSDHLCRMITIEDFYNFDFILGMDKENLQELENIKSQRIGKSNNTPTAKTELLGSYIGRSQDEIIKDPYFCNDISAFRHIFVQIAESCNNFLKINSK